MNTSLSRKKQDKLEVNQLISYSTLKTIEQIGKYYNRNKNKLPPILQSRRIFVQQIQSSPSDRNSKTIQDCISLNKKEDGHQTTLQKVRYNCNKQMGSGGLVQIKPKLGLIIFEKGLRSKIKRQSLLPYCLSTKNKSNNQNSNQQQKIIQKNDSTNLYKGQLINNTSKQNKHLILALLDRMEVSDHLDNSKNKKMQKKYVPSINVRAKQMEKPNVCRKETINGRENQRKISKLRINTQIQESFKLLTKNTGIKTISNSKQRYNTSEIHNKQFLKPDSTKCKTKISKKCVSIESLEPWANEQEKISIDYPSYIRSKG